MYEFILASRSPRRQKLFSLIQKPFFIRPADVDERRGAGESPENYVVRLAQTKAEEVGERVADIAARDVVVFAADTTVVDEGEILGKPTDPDQARDILSRLRGKAHWVFSGLAVHTPSDGLTMTTLVKTEVEMRNYTEDEMEAYIASGGPFDKAGAYAIQNEEFHPVKSWQGCYANVMGLPLCHLEKLFAQLGIPLSGQLPIACQEKFNYECQIPLKLEAAEYSG